MVIFNVILFSLFFSVIWQQSEVSNSVRVPILVLYSYRCWLLMHQNFNFTGKFIDFYTAIDAARRSCTSRSSNLPHSIQLRLMGTGATLSSRAPMYTLQEGTCRIHVPWYCTVVLHSCMYGRWILFIYATAKPASPISQGRNLVFNFFKKIKRA